MPFPPFELERYFAQHEFTARYLLCLSDCESMSMRELLDLEPGSREAMEKLWLGYTESLGHPALREQIAAMYHGVTRDDVIVQVGAQEGILMFASTYLKPGDHVIVQTPCYQSLSQVPASLGCEVTKWEGDPNRNWDLDLDFLSQHLSKRTKAIILNQPHNPTGNLLSLETYREIARLADKNGAVLFCDEVYRGLEHPGVEKLPAACAISENGVSLGVMSKTYGLAGLRIGWMATRNRKLLQTMAPFKDYTTICSSAPSELLATIALKHADQIVQRNLSILNDNFDLWDRFVSQYSDFVECSRPRAGCLAFPKLRGGRSAAALAEEVLAKAGVLIAPGSKFGYSDLFFRVGLGRKSFPEALAKFATVIR